MDTLMAAANDTRGWILTIISGVACVLGASIICADIVIRLIPSKRDFRIQDSDLFLSASLSLSFGVMLFSALYTLLPSSKESLEAGGFSAKAATWILVACFVCGVVGIQLLSHVLHHYIPSHVVDCHHSHDDENTYHGHDPEHADHLDEHDHSENGRSGPRKSSRGSSRHSGTRVVRDIASADAPEPIEELPARPSLNLRTRLSFTLSKLSPRGQERCDVQGPCHGFSDPCGDECFKIAQARSRISGFRPRPSCRIRRSPIGRTVSMPYSSGGIPETEPLLIDNRTSPRNGKPSTRDQHLHEVSHVHNGDCERGLSDHSCNHKQRQKSTSSDTASRSGSVSKHHHHVPKNAFLSIGLQTSIAIALHKLPEGFITYATNHASATLGFSVFLALAIHNITEGFAMALPLYLALNSRWKAMLWALVLGGFSQPLGAGIAAIWFRLAGSGDKAPGAALYGGMFAVTSGIMTSVALQLYSESLDLTHDRTVCKVFAILGMAILGMSSALTAT